MRREGLYRETNIVIWACCEQAPAPAPAIIIIIIITIKHVLIKGDTLMSKTLQGHRTITN